MSAVPVTVDTSEFDPSYPTFPVLASLSIFLVLLPSYWHFKSGNVGTILYISWTLVGNVIYLVNSVVWAGNTIDHAPFWCDLSTKLMIGLSIAYPAVALVINRRLYNIATIQAVHLTKSESRKSAMIELAIGLGFPILVMILHVIVQGHRYDIYENIGCWPSTYLTPVTIPLVLIWPLVLGMCSVVYCSLAIRAFLQKRKQFRDLLQSHHSGLTVARYFRLMALSATEMAFGLPFSSYILAINIMTGIRPWISWDDTHYNFNRVERVPFAIFQLYPRSWIIVNVTRYALPAGGFFFFIYLGMSGEAGQFYKRLFWKVAGKAGIVRASETATTPGMNASWIARPGASNPGSNGMRIMTTTSWTTNAGDPKHHTASVELYAHNKDKDDKEHSASSAASDTDSFSLPPLPDMNYDALKSEEKKEVRNDVA